MKLKSITLKKDKLRTYTFIIPIRDNTKKNIYINVLLLKYLNNIALEKYAKIIEF